MTLGANSQEQTSLILVEEILHRVRNEFALAIAAIRLSEKRISDPAVRQVLDAAARKLHAHANTLYVLRSLPAGESLAVGDYIERICSSIVGSALANTHIRLTLRICDAKLDAERCWRLGLIVSELITNAARHGLGWKEGDIGVEFDVVGDEHRCSVSDSGCVLATPQPGRGCRIATSLAAQMGGTVEWQFGGKGSIVFLRVPIANRCASPS